MQSETTDLFITNEVPSPTELLGQVEDSFVRKYSGMLNRILWHQQPTPTKYGFYESVNEGERDIMVM